MFLALRTSCMVTEANTPHLYNTLGYNNRWQVTTQVNRLLATVGLRENGRLQGNIKAHDIKRL